MAYRTGRKKIVEALVKQLKEIDGNHPYNVNVFENVTKNGFPR